jgi:hypothetical protein
MAEGVPPLRPCTTRSYNWADLPAIWAESFWLGWADGSTYSRWDHNGRINRELYDLGHALGDTGVNGASAMAHLIQYVNDMADKRDKAEANRQYANLPENADV